jgi:acetoin utilization deacetylase AcuC-like enzyme
MITFYNELHVLHQGRFELFRGRLVPCYEVAARADNVLAELRKRNLGAIEAPQQFDDSLLLSVHTPRYIDFLRGAWGEWVALDPANALSDALPAVWPVRRHRDDVLPANFAARIGLFSFDAGTPLTSGSWQVSRTGAWCALSAASRVLAGGRSAFALTRPPGHHAGSDFFGGYGFINNAALAAQALRDGGASRVAVLDIDYHHGNGTQTIFYDRADVFYASIHGDPHTEYPFFLGYADETGTGEGHGFNLNLPLPKGTAFPRWKDTLQQALNAVSRFGADALVISLGVDTFAGDPISGFTLNSVDYLEIGKLLADAGLPAVFVFEGGYALDEIGVNTVNVLEGFIRCV